MEYPSKNIGDELLCDAEMSPESPDGSSEDWVYDDDIISVSEETPKVQESVNRKRKIVASKIDSFFDFVPKQSTSSADQPASSNPMKFNVSGAHKVWTDPVKEKDKARRRKKKRQRREAHMSDIEKRRQKVIWNLYELEIEKQGIDKSGGLSDKDKQDVIDAVIAVTKKPEKKKERENGVRATQTVGSDKTCYGELDSSFQRLYTDDDKLFFFNEFCKHHKLTSEAAAEMAIKGGKGCAWNAITKHIAREHPKL